MKNLIIIAGIGLLIINITAGIIVKKYLIFNQLLADQAIIFTTVLLFLLSNSKIKDGYKIGLSFVLPIILLIKLTLSLLSPGNFSDNYYFLGILGLSILEVLLILSAKSVNKFA